jgi:hypothetical protein
LGVLQTNIFVAPATTPTPKRKAEVIDLEVIEERTVKKPFKPIVKTPAPRKEDSLYQISVTVHPGLDKYPRELRGALQEACQTAFYTYMFALQAGNLSKHHQTYSIIAGTRVRSESVTFENTTTFLNIMDLSIANATLLKFFADRIGDRLDKKSFQEQKHEGLTNSELLELYSVRRGDLGWSFDAGGCLSIYGSALVGKKTKEHVWYVKAGGIKLEGET